MIFRSPLQPFPPLLQDRTLVLKRTGVSLQRLFSTFASGFPGIGLLLQRLITAAALECSVFAHFHGTLQGVSVALLLIDGGAALLLLVGLWTPVAGAVIACCELWMVVSGGEFWLPLVLATLGAALAMIGPGAWSIDALLFGRKQIGPPSRQKRNKPIGQETSHPI
jgi:putative oxidoreductase